MTAADLHHPQHTLAVLYTLYEVVVGRANEPLVMNTFYLIFQDFLPIRSRRWTDGLPAFKVDHGRGGMHWGT